MKFIYFIIILYLFSNSCSKENLNNDYCDYSTAYKSFFHKVLSVEGISISSRNENSNKKFIIDNNIVNLNKYWDSTIKISKILVMQNKLDTIHLGDYNIYIINENIAKDTISRYFKITEFNFNYLEKIADINFKYYSDFKLKTETSIVGKLDISKCFWDLKVIDIIVFD